MYTLLKFTVFGRYFAKIASTCKNVLAEIRTIVLIATMMAKETTFHLWIYYFLSDISCKGLCFK